MEGNVGDARPVTTTPTTQAGRELLTDYHERLHEPDCDCDAAFIRSPILAIEAEARDATGLRDALDAHEWRLGWRDDDGEELWGCSCAWSTRYEAGQGDRMWRDHREQAVRAALAAAPPEPRWPPAEDEAAVARLTAQVLANGLLYDMDDPIGARFAARAILAALREGGER